MCLEDTVQESQQDLHSGWPPPENLEKSAGILTLVRESQEHCGLPVVCRHSCDGHKINTASSG